MTTSNQFSVFISYYCRAALETLGKLCECVDLREYAARIIHPLIRFLDLSPDLRPVAMNTLTQIVTQMGKNFSIFIPAVYKVCKTLDR